MRLRAERMYRSYNEQKLPPISRLGFSTLL